MFSEEHKKNLSQSKMGDKNPFYGEKHSAETRKKMSQKAKERFAKMSEDERKEMFKFCKDKFGVDHPKYILDRSQLKREDRRNDSVYQEWRKEVYQRDNWICKINNQDCNGKIEAHHILSWRDYPELRYEVNNGITLCHSHHPRKREEEKRLVPELQELMSVSKE